MTLCKICQHLTWKDEELCPACKLEQETGQKLHSNEEKAKEAEDA